MPHLNKAVSLFEEESDYLNETLIYIQILLYLLSFITLALILKLIFIPLRDSLVSREKELFKAVSKLKEEGQYKSTFLANMGHELRTPLNGILGMVDLLNEEENLTQEQSNLIQVIEQSGRSLLHIVDDILEITQIEMKKVEFRDKDFNPEFLLTQIINDCFMKAKEKNIDFEWERSTLPLMVRADQHKIKQIMSHLLNNALKYTEEGSIKVVTVYDEISSLLTFKVHDTGIGVPENKIETIFEPFKQVDSTATRLYGGTGLGLAISKELTEAMGGTLKINSELGVGTTFTLTLPLKEVERKNAEKILEVSEEEKLRGNILLIDSDDLSRKIMINLVGHLGPSIETALSPKVGQRLSMTKNYQIVFIKIPSNDKNFVNGLEGLINDFPKTTKVFLIVDLHKNNLNQELDLNLKQEVIDILEAPLKSSDLKLLLEKHL